MKLNRNYCLIALLVIIVLFLTQYSSSKGNLLSGMKGKKDNQGNTAQSSGNEDDGQFVQNLGLQVPGETSPNPKGLEVKPSSGLGFNSGPVFGTELDVSLLLSIF